MIMVNYSLKGVSMVKIFTRFTFFLILILIISNFSCFTTNAQPAKKAKERIKQLKLVKLLDILNLDDKTSDKFISKYNALDKAVENIKDEIEIATDELELSIRKNESKDEINKKSEKLIKLDDKLGDAILEKFKELKTLLNDSQYAKLILFEHKFPKEFQRILYEQGMKGQQGRYNNDKSHPFGN
jgi:hypothetical protein